MISSGLSGLAAVFVAVCLAVVAWLLILSRGGRAFRVHVRALGVAIQIDTSAATDKQPPRADEV